MNISFEKPKNFGPFELLGRVGRGATSNVYKARQKSDGQIVALKMGARQLSLDEESFTRFKREFTIVQHLRHSNLIETLEFGEEKQVPYLVLEFVEGVSLERLLHDKGVMPLVESAELILQVAEGLRFLHQNQIVHRDVKPGNVLVNEKGLAKLGDFGVLKTLAANSGMTADGKAMGTVEFGAPEQFEDAKSTDVRCDIYSLAATFYATLTGLFPFGCGSLRRILGRKQKNKCVPLRRIDASLPSALEELVARSLQADRERRPATMDEFIDCLTDVVTSQGIVAHNVSFPAVPNDLDPRKSGAERRTAVRISVTLPADFVPFQLNKRSSFRATIIDVSTGGLCLQTNMTTPMNTLIEITASETGITYISQVRWVKKIGENDFVLGCSFACRPDPEELIAMRPNV